MTTVKMRECDLCEAIGKDFAEIIIRVSDSEELRGHVCEDDVEKYFGELPTYARRGRRVAAEA